MTTATGPTARSVARSARGPLALLAVLVLAGVVVAALRETGDQGRLEPRSFEPQGGNALRVLLEDRGVEVVRQRGTEGVDGQGDATVLVVDPELLADGDAARLREVEGELVLVGAPGSLLDALDLDVSTRGTARVETRRPACDLPAAARAGTATLGGARYAGPSGAVGCYASAGAATLLVLPERRTTLLGDGDLLTNELLDEEGNAALALGLLGSSDRVVWVVPGPVALGEGQRSLWSLLDESVRAGTAGLVLAVVVLALWRARGLGRVVPEPLPVVVRAAEAVEGRARLYRAAGARGTAAESLRAGVRVALVGRLGLPPDTGREALVTSAAARTGRDPAGVDALLYGPAPVDDPALVRLADSLDALTREALTRLPGAAARPDPTEGAGP